jgi:hypothetical protein
MLRRPFDQVPSCVYEGMRKAGKFAYFLVHSQPFYFSFKLSRLRKLVF